MNRRKSPRYKLILNMPDLVSRHTKIGSSVFTVLFWAIFVYLWMPVITVIAWMTGLYHSYSELTYMRELEDLSHLALAYATIVAALGGTLLMWALQEYLRFRNVNRRREPVAVNHHEMAKYVNFDESDVAAGQNARRLVVHHGMDGRVMRFA
ncbi:MAG TPA: poly-beta-1,6-N-acetyl-D-glucosamine biosynthesis protein PgaD [Oxalicibacterium sp.]|uniref:poly-beta-1,6-N-acetyl-D-glucosamine biosynthesis protein PgaD n=1 Tax=Oxalicibacterium sp. TaxID=2766525 RepID=UPI002CC1B5ED|nr:poly-beta-1,6-N-acetyl-D-glucosamine biosynthesis protein PgaD [Oxalicibacterium sp.]HWU97284.1 poly-beta-1,6-N-acetyl-D-glucosamine biosynthesis protein PgaD [Oxalicibacterium sp.]